MPEENAGSSSTPSKAVPSLAKKQSDVTRLGAQKLKFVPTLPARRKKEDAKQEEAPVASSSTERGRGRGRGRGDDRGRGRGRGDGPGRGAAPPRPSVEMTASGPFALGPAMAGSAGSRRAAPRSNFTPILPGGAARGALGSGLTNTTAPSLGIKKEPNDLNSFKKEGEATEDDGEVYSDPDEGVEIVDMENVRAMDWMAPESLRKEKEKKKVKKERKEEADKKGKGIAQPDTGGHGPTLRENSVEEVNMEDAEDNKINLANALNLSDSEEEEELEDIIDDFAQAMDMGVDGGANQQDRIYFFQFPNPFPQFYSPSATLLQDKGKDKESDDTGLDAGAGKKVSFASDAKPPAVAASVDSTKSGDKQEKEEPLEEKVEGLIGQLEVYQGGAVKMRLANGIVMDVTASTQPSFLQHATYVDPATKRICVLGEISRRFVVSPDIQTLLDSLERAEAASVEVPVALDGLISMDTT